MLIEKLCLLLFLSWNIVVCEEQSADKPLLSTPEIRRVRSETDPPSFIIFWDPVTSDLKNQILGYMVKVWEMPRNKTVTVHIKEGNGVMVTKKYETFDRKLFNSIPSSEPVFSKDFGPLDREAMFENLKKDQHYMIRVQAYTGDGEGPYSPPIGIRIPDKEWFKI